MNNSPWTGSNRAAASFKVKSVDISNKQKMQDLRQLSLFFYLD